MYSSPEDMLHMTCVKRSNLSWDLEFLSLPHQYSFLSAINTYVDTRESAIPLLDSNVGTGEIDLTSLERVPLPGEQSVVRDVVRNLDLLGDSVTAGDCCLTGAKLRIVDTLTLGIIEAVAGEPVIAVASFILTAIGTVVAGLSIDTGAFKKTFVKAGLGCLLLLVGW